MAANLQEQDRLTTGEAISDTAWLDRRSIEQRADEIRRKYGDDKIPVAPVMLANQLGIKVHTAKFSDSGMVGAIARRGDNVILLVNYDDPIQRKRFTIAHEIGHYLLHLSSSDGEFEDNEIDLFRQHTDNDAGIETNRRQEIQANMFAAALLMPRDMVRLHWMRERSIAKMAGLFNVSEEAMGIRIAKLGLT